MKIQELVRAEKGIPFYQVKIGEYFQFIISGNHYYESIEDSPYIYSKTQVLKKIDEVGAIDYPYDRASEENTLFVGDKVIVKVIRKTSKAYKEYSKE
jgi:hypothetical protein